jgi:uncharacterized protein (DUF58 family)
VSAHRTTVLPADRGSRQHLKIMQLLAAVEADGRTPLDEALLTGLSRLRRGMTLVVVTPSLERDWVRPLATLRSRGVGCVAVLVDAPAFAAYSERTGPQRRAQPAAAAQATADDPDAATAQRARALRHALAEFQIRTLTVLPDRPLAETLVA